MKKANTKKVVWIDRRTREPQTNVKRANITYAKFHNTETKETIEYRFNPDLRTEDEIIAMLRGLMHGHEYSTYWILEKVEII